MAQVSVIGAGYVGLTVGACMAHLGHSVVVADIDAAKIDQLQRGELPIYETGLQALAKEGQDAGRLRFVVGAATACKDATFHFLCVPTPYIEGQGVDLSYVTTAASDIADALAPGSIIVNKSTVPVGTTTIVEQVVQRGDVQVVSNPEFLREGAAVNDFLHPDRIVIGSAHADAAALVAELYSGIDAPVIVTDPVSSELIKYASNAFLATKLTFVNEIATLCEHLGADIEEVTRGMGFDPRVGNSFLHPGPGWGGSCFPKDTATMVQIAADAGVELDFLTNVIDMNERQIMRTAGKVRACVGGDLDGRRVAVWGLTFKAGTDDLRSSPALAVLRQLVDGGAIVTAYDPTVSMPLIELKSVNIVPNPIDATRDAEVLVILTEWPQFTSVDLERVANEMAGDWIVDGRNLFEPKTLEAAGFNVIGIGR